MSAEISFCTTCMDRLEHLEQTLPENVKILGNYPSCELILLNHGGDEETDEWVRAHFRQFRSTCRFEYYSNLDKPKYYVSAYARNVVHRLGACRSLCNLDADNFLTVPFMKWITEQFDENDDFRIAATDHCPSFYGRITIDKGLFCAIGGHNEDFNNGPWGEDTDLVNRALLYGASFIKMPKNLGKFIEHSDEVRTQHTPMKNPATIAGIHDGISAENIRKGVLVANRGRPWGSARLRKNFIEDVQL